MTNIITYCAVGVRSNQAIQELRKAGYPNTFNGGGYNDVDERTWLESQCPVVDLSPILSENFRPTFDPLVQFN